MSKFNLVILSVGSLLGQNVLDALEGRRDRVHVIGVNSVVDNPRVFRCDKAYLAPVGKAREFEQFLLDVLTKEHVHAVLPGRDEDILILLDFVKRYPDWKHVFPSGHKEAAMMMHDKALSLKFSASHNLPFVSTLVLEENEWSDVVSWVNEVQYPIIAKPREGFGSNGIRILINHEQLAVYQDAKYKDYIFQKLVGMNPQNLSNIVSFEQTSKMGIPFFFHLPDDLQYAGQSIIHKDGSIGDIFVSKSLMVLGRCERSESIEDKLLESVTLDYAKAIAKEGWTGPFNLQCRKVSESYLGIEMNGRMSGSTSARAWMGFDEVRTYLKSFHEFDLGQDLRYERNVKGWVTRSLTDTFIREEDVKQLSSTKEWANNRVQSLVVTGSTGYIGHQLVQDLYLKGYQLTLISHQVENANNLFKGLNLTIVDAKEIDQIDWKSVDALVHLGFARPHRGELELMRSVRFSHTLFSHAVGRGIRRIINLSSRSVYGSYTDDAWDETSPLNPSNVYGEAKRTVETMLNEMAHLSKKVHHVSIRLGNVIGVGHGRNQVFVVDRLLEKALKDHHFVIEGGQQLYDILDLRDVSSALIKVLSTPSQEWDSVYNLGSSEKYQLVKLAQVIIDRIRIQRNVGTLNFKLIEAENTIRYNMNVSKFMKQFDWKPSYTIEQSIDAILNSIDNTEE